MYEYIIKISAQGQESSEIERDLASELNLPEKSLYIALYKGNENGTNLARI